MPKDKEKGWVEISFFAKSKFLITVEILPSYAPLKLSVGKDRDVEMLLTFLYMRTQKELKDETLTKDILVYAEALVDRKDKLLELKIKNLMTY